MSTVSWTQPEKVTSAFDEAGVQHGELDVPVTATGVLLSTYGGRRDVAFCPTTGTWRRIGVGVGRPDGAPMPAATRIELQCDLPTRDGRYSLRGRLSANGSRLLKIDELVPLNA